MTERPSPRIAGTPPWLGVHHWSLAGQPERGAVRAAVVTRGGMVLADVETGERLYGEVDLSPCGVRVCRLVRP